MSMNKYKILKICFPYFCIPYCIHIFLCLIKNSSNVFSISRKLFLKLETVQWILFNGYFYSDTYLTLNIPLNVIPYQKNIYYNIYNAMVFIKMSIVYEAHFDWDYPRNFIPQSVNIP